VGASGVFALLTPIFFTMHWIFLLLALLLFLVAILHLLEVVKRGKVMKSRG
jgi:cadmium resistance protein CadD (predicted permease)